MPLSAGIRLGPYEILAPIGAGGMGEVYRARDTRLDRIVALKVVRGNMAERADVRQRFEREARAISSLNHPHICALYDVGHQDDIDFLVMEHLEGENLAERLAKGPLPIDEVLREAVQIAAGLDWAHRQRVTHRDLKPGNIILTRHGAKLLDFGLAKIVQPSLFPLPEGSAATQTQLTVEGTVVGTFQYMAPEQLEGQPADARSDIFAFGAVLYEMATGRKAFAGKSQASLIAAILHTDPAPFSPGDSAAAADVRARALERAVAKCLAKDPDRRWQAVSDLKDEMEWIAQLPWGAPAAPETAHRRLIGWIAGALAAAAIVAAVFFLRPHQDGPRRAPIRFQVQAPPNTWWEQPITAQTLALSPEGGNLAFVATTLDQTQVWIRPLGSLEAHPIAGTQGAYSVFWAPDSNSIIFYAGKQLKRVALAGGLPQVICDIPEPMWRGVTLPNGDLLLNTNSATYRISTSGTASVLPNKSFLWPELLPDGDHVLYRSRGLVDTLVESLESGQRAPLIQGDSHAEYAPPLEGGDTGHLVYIKSGTLMAQPFDARRRRLEGQPVSIDENLDYFEPTSGAAFSVSRDGILAYQKLGLPARVTWVDRGGNETQLISPPANLWGPIRLSPDGQRIAVSIRTAADGGNDLWIYESGRQGATRFTFDPGSEVQPVWAPDGKRIAFAEAHRSPPVMMWKAIGDTGSGETVIPGAFRIATDWSRDGRFIFFQTSGTDRNSDVGLVEVAGADAAGRKPSTLIHTQFSNYSAALSPDSRWVAFVSDETGRPEVYVQAFRGEGTPRVEGERHRISTGGGQIPRWRRDGKELFFVASDNRVMATAFISGPEYHAGEPAALFRLRSPIPELSTEATAFDVAADGQHFIVAVTETTAMNPVNVIVNWQAGLGSPAPASGSR